NTVDLALRDGGYPELLQRRDQARAEGRLYGIGLCAAVEPSISNMGYITTALTPEQRRKAGPKNGSVSTATISIDPLGGVTAHISSTPQGQGHQTVAAQVVAEALGLDPQDILVNVELDTGKDPWSIASGNCPSRSSGAVAGAVHKAAVKMRERLAGIAATLLEQDADQMRFAGGKVYIENGPSLAFHRVAGTAHWAPAMLPENETGGLRET